MKDELPKTVMIDVNLTLPKKLRKDLHDGEIICSVCNGMGIVKRDMAYGLSFEVNQYGCRWKHEYFIPCPHCYNGVIKVCKYCGHPNRDKKYTHAETTCLCKDAQNARDEESRKKDAARWDKAEKVPFDEACKQFDFLYVDNFDQYVDVDDFEDWITDNTDEETGDLRIYGTEITKMQFDACSLIEGALEELHEDAADSISGEDEKELQNLLDGWAEKNECGTKTYWPDWSIGVILSR